MNRRITPFLAVLVTLGAGVLLGAGPAVQTTDRAPRELFPDTRDRGRAAVEFEGEALHAVAAYYYSQRNHDSRWLLIELAITSSTHMRIDPDDILLRQPDGREIPLASQRIWRQDHQRVVPLLQNAAVTRHGVSSYFKRSGNRQFRFFVRPTEGIVDRFFDIDQHRFAWGDLFFASPTGAWDAGTYSLVINGEEDTQAVLPIDLD